MKLSLCVVLAAVCVVPATIGQNPSVPKPPDTPKRPVVEEYQGVKITDDYRWLENGDDAEVKRWSVSQNTFSRNYLDRLTARAAIKDRLKQLVNAGSPRYYDLRFRGGTIFAMKFQPDKQQPLLVALGSSDDTGSAKVIFDPNVGSSAVSRSVDFYVPSLDGQYIAAAVSDNGSEDSHAVIFEVVTGKELKDVVPRVNFATAGGSIEWKADDSGFYYTRFPQGDERPPEDANFYQQVYFHKIGSDPKQDTYVIGKEFPRIGEIQLRSSNDGNWLLAAVANGDGGEVEHYVMDSSGRWTQITHFEDAGTSAKFGSNNELYLLSHKDAPRGKILRLPKPDAPLSQAKVIVPESPGSNSGADEDARASISSFEPARTLLYVTDIIGGPSRIRVFDDHGLISTTLRPPISVMGRVVPLGGDSVLLYISSFIEPPAWWRFNSETKKLSRTALAETPGYKFDDAEVVREFAISKDSTRVPMNIIRRKGTRLDGNNPTLLYAYGGYGISEEPYFAGYVTRMWLDQGGVYVDANLRGGGEYGEEWHKAGNLTNKQNVFDDFAACAQYLIDHKYTSAKHLAILGGSNGGLLMGAALIQHPDFYGAVVSYVGIYDMLRVELDPNGAFNVTEFGTVKNPAQFKALYGYSPYHHVKDGTTYPPILFLTGENDHRVNPMQSRKMTARLQAANSSGHPMLLRTSSNAGHGIGTALDEQIEQDADVFSFLFDRLDISYTKPKN